MSTSSSMHDTCQDPSVGEEVVCSLHEPPSAISGIFWDLPGSDKACFPMGSLCLAALHSKTWLQERERPLTFSFFFFKSFYLLYPQRECQSVHCIRNWKAFLSSSLCESREKSCFGFQACSGEPHFACLVWFAAQIPLTAGTPLTALKERKGKKEKRKGRGGGGSHISDTSPFPPDKELSYWKYSLPPVPPADGKCCPDRTFSFTRLIPKVKRWGEVCFFLGYF